MHYLCSQIMAAVYIDKITLPPLTCFKQQQSVLLLVPSMAGSLDKVKRLVSIHIANTNNKSSDSSAYVGAANLSGNAAIHGTIFLGHINVLSFLLKKCRADLTMKNGLG